MQGVPHHECLWTLQLAEPKQPGRNRFYQLTQGLATWSSTHINTPHTGCLLTCLSPWWMIWSYLATHGTIPCDVEDSTAHGSKLTHNHQVYRKPTTIWHPGNETCKANVKKKTKPWSKGLSYWVYHIWWPSQISPREPRSATSLRRIPMAPLLEEVAPEPGVGKIIMSIINI